MKIFYSLYQYDLDLLLWCTHRYHQKQLTYWAKILSKTGDGYIQIILPTALLLINVEHSSAFFMALVICFSFQLPIYWVLKNSLRRDRPSQAIASFKSFILASDQFSFPSGHSSAAFLLAHICLLFYGHLALPLYLWASLVAISRVILGVHFPSDILAGVALSLGTLWLSSNYLLPFFFSI